MPWADIIRPFGAKRAKYIVVFFVGNHLIHEPEKDNSAKAPVWESRCMVPRRYGARLYPQKEIFVSRETFVFQFSDDSGVNQPDRPGNILD
jgi:hypothetical protein